MNQYIITEERLIEFEKALPKYWMTPDHFIVNRDEKIADVRSHPYKSRDEVLDDIDKILDRRTELMEELYEELRNPEVARHSLQQIQIIRFKVEELRQAGEPK